MTRRSTKRTCLGAFFALILATVGALILAISAAAAPPAPTAPWPGTGALTVARGFHTADRNAVLLGNGKLLVAGGEGTNGRIGTIMAAADLFDPATATWSAAAPLAAARDYHSTTLLHDGRVLVTGGYDVWNNSLASAELYDPLTGTWAPAAPMNISRGYHTATVLGDGRVLVVGGDTSTLWTPTATAELYDPVANTWTVAASPANAHAAGVAELLPDGRVLVAGGYAPGGPIQQTAASEIFDASTGTWSTVAPMTAARTCASVALVNGKVLVAGGENDRTGYLSSAELFDPATGTWTKTGMLKARHACAASVKLADGRVVVAGGLGPSSTGAIPEATVETYSPLRGTWTTVSSLVGAGDHQAAGLLADGRMVVAGGYYNLAGVAASQIFTP